MVLRAFGDEFGPQFSAPGIATKVRSDSETAPRQKPVGVLRDFNKVSSKGEFPKAVLANVISWFVSISFNLKYSDCFPLAFIRTYQSLRSASLNEKAKGIDEPLPNWVIVCSNWFWSFRPPDFVNTSNKNFALELLFTVRLIDFVPEL